MKKITIVLMILTGMVGIKIAKAQVMFQQMDSLLSINNCVHQTFDGGYITSGSVIDTSKVYGCLLKLDNNGNSVWSKKYAANSFYVSGEYSEQTADGGYILAAELRDTSFVKRSSIIKTDPAGNLTWSVAVGNYINNVRQTADGGYIAFSDPLFYDSTNAIVKINNSGIISWAKSIRIYTFTNISSLQQTPDGGFIIAGATQDSLSSASQLYLCKMDGLGNSQWTKTYSGNNLTVSSISITSGSGYLLSGQTGNSSLLIKTNSSGTIAWSKTYGNTLFAMHGIQTNDNGYIFTGAFYNIFCFLAKTDSSGNQQWCKIYGDTLLGPNTQGCFVNQTTDNGYIVSGLIATNFNMLVNEPLYLVKTDINGNSGCNEHSRAITDSAVVITAAPHAVVVSSGITVYNIPITASNHTPRIINLCNSTGVEENLFNEQLTLYPNPATSQLTIAFSEEQKNTSIKIINILGEIVFQSAITNKQSTINIDISSLAKGMYVIELTKNDTQVVRRKIIKE